MTEHARQLGLGHRAAPSRRHAVCSPSTVRSNARAPADSMIWLPRGYGDDGGGGGEEGGECQQRRSEGCWRRRGHRPGGGRRRRRVRGRLRRRPVVCPSRSVGAVAARWANPIGVMTPTPQPIRTAAITSPAMPGISTAAQPIAVSASPAAKPVRSPMRPRSRARPARGWTHGGGRGQQRHDRPGGQRAQPSPGADHGQKPHPDRQGGGGGGQRQGRAHEPGAGEPADKVGHGLPGAAAAAAQQAPPGQPSRRPQRRAPPGWRTAAGSRRRR